MSGLKLALVLLLWTIYVGRFLQAILQRRGDDQFRIVVWWMFFLACLAFTFTGREVEEATDQLFGGLPVSIYIKFFAMIQIAYLYYRLMHTVNPLPATTFQLLRWLNRISIGTGIVSFAMFLLLDMRSNPDTRYYVSAARDSIVAVYMLFGIIPINLYLFKQEAVPTMRVKHVLNTLLCITYLLITLSSLVSLVIVNFHLGNIEQLLPIFLPLTYLVFVFFLSALLPHRWIAVLLFPARLYTYLRLRRLQHDVQRLTKVRYHFEEMPVRLLSLGELEFAIYQTVIFILDHAALMHPSSEKHHLSRQLAEFLEQEMSYPALVKGMARLKYDRSNS